jgi:hypothetical protein
LDAKQYYGFNSPFGHVRARGVWGAKSYHLKLLDTTPKLIFIQAVQDLWVLLTIRIGAL